MERRRKNKNKKKTFIFQLSKIAFLCLKFIPLLFSKLRVICARLARRLQQTINNLSQRKRTASFFLHCAVGSVCFRSSFNVSAFPSKGFLFSFQLKFYVYFFCCRFVFTPFRKLLRMLVCSELVCAKRLCFF